jgi:hypothetical protein
LPNINFKIFTKVITNRLIEVAHRVIQPTQSTFLPGRNILKGVIDLHETIHEMHRKKHIGVIIKIDFDKAYDKVKWPFVKYVFEMKGFSFKWCQLIYSIIQGGHVGPNFQTKKGLREADPFSPLLFNIVVNMLAILIKRAKTEGQFDGVVPHLMDDGLSILQYEDDLEKAKNLKLLLYTFEKLSGLKINFHKSEIFYLGEAKEVQEQYFHIYGCSGASYPFRYLGFLCTKKISNSDWKMIEQRIEKKLSSWKGKLLLVGGRLVLINLVLPTLVEFMLSFFEVPQES